MVNRLANSASPYLLQHADNPVDWREWGDEAFAEARRSDRPVLLSVGYAACHWCHVMAHESFEDDKTAALMNELFVNVKVDREERPDVDSVYMAATQALTGHGGWPMTVFLTPEGRPFYAGTYFPPEPRHGMPAFRQVLIAIAQSWREQREEVMGASARIAQSLAGRGMPGAGAVLDEAVLEAAVLALAQQEDRSHGGFGGPMKFPPSAVCAFLLRHAARLELVKGPELGEGPESGEPGTGTIARGLADRTLRVMAMSGLYDQLAGGFARYAVDPGWVVPHFEKMLYDNAQLARVYLHWWRLTGDPLGARIAVETCDWMLAALRTPQGGLASSLDADTPVRDADGSVHGVEGFTYVWTPAQLVEILGPQDGEWAAELLRVTVDGSFEHGTSTLQMARAVWSDSQDSDSQDAERWRRIRPLLLAARDQRPQPARDDKIVAAWNGLAVAALAETGALLGRPDLMAAAEEVADLLLAVHVVAEDGLASPRVRLRRVSRDGTAGTPSGVLEDYGDVAEGLLALHCVTGDPAWLEVAGGLLDTVLEQFTDGSDGFFDTPADGTDSALTAVGRPQDPTDGAHPGGWTAATGALLSYSALTGSSRHRAAAEAALGLVAAVGRQAPIAIGWGLAVAEALLDGPREVAVAGIAGPKRDALHLLALSATAPGCVVSAGEPDADGIPLLAGRAERHGGPAAYVCRNFVCDAPTSDLVSFAQSVGARMARATSLFA